MGTWSTENIYIMKTSAWNIYSQYTKRISFLFKFKKVSFFIQLLIFKVSAVVLLKCHEHYNSYFLYRRTYTSDISFEIYETSLRRVSYISYEMTTSVRFCLSYDPFNGIKSPIKLTLFQQENADTDVANDVTYTRQSVVIRFL